MLPHVHVHFESPTPLIAYPVTIPVEENNAIKATRRRLRKSTPTAATEQSKPQQVVGQKFAAARKPEGTFKGTETTNQDA